MIKGIKKIVENYFNIEIKRIRNDYVKGFSLFDDLLILIKSEKPILIDVGSNYGQFIDLFRERYKSYKIFGVEPDEILFQFLKDKYKGNTEIEFFNNAMGGADEDKIFNIYESRDLNSFCNLSQIGTFSEIKKLSEKVVSINTLNNFVNQKEITKIDLLKIDTQGFDYEVLKGASILLKQKIVKNIVVEVNFTEVYKEQNSATDVINILTLHHYKPVGLYDIFRDECNEGINWCNMLFSLSSGK